MGGNTFGKIFTITTCGESHGEAIGVIIDGCPPGIEITESEIQKELDRRKPGQSKITTPRKEKDQLKILSGFFNGKTTGTPILLLIENFDMKSQDYDSLKNIYRPSHADYTYEMKYGIRDHRGSGRASARETAARVAASAIAKKFLKNKFGIEIFSYVEQIGCIKTNIDYKTITIEDIENNIVRCPDKIIANRMIDLIETIKNQSDSIGGVIRGVIKNAPIGLGEPVFNKISSNLAAAMMSINAVKGFEIGSGFECAKMLGSEHNDSLIISDKKIKTKTNNAGGIVGGITNGEDIYFRVAFKPPSTISKKQMSVAYEYETDVKNEVGKQNYDSNTAKRFKEIEFTAHGRHDPCIVTRAVPVVDAMSALVMIDQCLLSYK